MCACLGIASDIEIFLPFPQDTGTSQQSSMAPPPVGFSMNVKKKKGMKLKQLIRKGVFFSPHRVSCYARSIWTVNILHMEKRDCPERVCVCVRGGDGCSCLVMDLLCFRV